MIVEALNCCMEIKESIGTIEEDQLTKNWICFMCIVEFKIISIS